MTNPTVGHNPACERARALIGSYILDELRPADSAWLAAHVGGCAVCRTELATTARVRSLVASLPVPQPSIDLDERILRAVIEARARRLDHHSWLADLRTQILRGAVRTTGTLVATILVVALLGGAFVLAASEFITKLPVLTEQGATIRPVATPTASVPATQKAVSATARPSDGAPVTAAPEVTPPPTATPAPTPTATPTATPAPTPTATPTPTPSPSATVEPSPSPSPSATAEPTPTPSPSPTPTDKPHLTPPPSADPTISP